MNAIQTYGSGDRMLPGGQGHVSELAQGREGVMGAAVDANLRSFDASTETRCRVLDGLRRTL
ncbi:hypothetical protein OG478_35405 [Streptomyces phaeochromogenes]|uniref:hypothetical protein n=1 Tax=Streptomyces phaeochromogenes TaxID=1923 RepID=UPI00386B9D79|nr:hypothetical protein OG478_35405 [Streptomyces phaeochromogenes]